MWVSSQLEAIEEQETLSAEQWYIAVLRDQKQITNHLL